MLPNNQRDYKFGDNAIPKIRSGKGRGQKAYWLCKCKDSPYYGQGRIAEDGADCEHFDNAYETPDKTLKWVENCYADRNKKTIKKKRGRIKHG